jgi:hypothetical protein
VAFVLLNQKFLCNVTSIIVFLCCPFSLLAPDINYTIRQGCYSICLQLARFLLCGQTVTGDGLGSVSSLEDVKGGAISVPVTPPALTQPLSIVVEKPSAGSHAVQVRRQNGIVPTGMFS